MATVAIHIVTYNSAATIEACLKSVQAQRYPDFAIQVLDNASTDATAALVQAAGVPFIANPDNLGYAVAHNQLLERLRATPDHADVRYVLTLNPDVWLDPGFLGAMVAALEADPALGSAAGLLLRVERLGETPTHVDGAGLYIRRNRRQGLRAEGVPINKAPTTRTPIFGPDGAAAFYRRAMLDDVRVQGEVFDSDFFMHKEDIDLAWRALLRGWRSQFVPEAIAHHVRGFRPGQRERVSAAMRFYAVRNRYLLLLKDDLPRLFLRDLAAITLYDLGILGYLLLRERASLRALASAWALRGRMLHKRRLIHGRRTASIDDMWGWFDPPPSG